MFKNKTVIITGGSSGIGKSTALLFAQNNANVVITYKSNKKGADETVQELTTLGSESLAIKANLINEDEARNVIKQTVERFGKIDVLVNNAGRYIDGDEWDGASDIWTESIQQNLVSVMNISKHIIKVFEKQRHGNIINIASRHGVKGRADTIAYGAAKAGVINITQAYAELLGNFGGRVNVISPSAVKAGYWITAPKEELDAQDSLIDPLKIAEQILFLASDDSKEMNGENIQIKE